MEEWEAVSLLSAEKRFRKVKGYKDKTVHFVKDYSGNLIEIKQG